MTDMVTMWGGFILMTALYAWLQTRRPPGKRPGSLELVHHAWLMGGPRRAADVLLVELQEKGAIAITDASPPCVTLRGVGGQLSGYSRRAFDAINRGGTCSVADARWRLVDVMEKVRKDLLQQDLICERRSGWAIVYGVAIAGLLIWTTPSIVAGGLAVGLSILALMFITHLSPRVTHEGLAERERFRRQNYHISLAPQEGQAAIAVAVGSVAALYGTPAVAYVPPGSTSSSSSSSSSSSGCGTTSVACGSASSGGSSSSSGGFASGGGFGGDGGSSSGSDGGSSGCGGGGCGGGGCGG